MKKYRCVVAAIIALVGACSEDKNCEIPTVIRFYCDGDKCECSANLLNVEGYVDLERAHGDLCLVDSPAKYGTLDYVGVRDVEASIIPSSEDGDAIIAKIENAVIHKVDLPTDGGVETGFEIGVEYATEILFRTAEGETLSIYTLDGKSER